MNHSKLLLSACLLCSLSLPVHAINKCMAESGNVTYTDGDCPAGSTLSDRLPLADQPNADDVKRAQDAAVKLKQDEAQRANDKLKRASMENETAGERRYRELLEQERRKVEALEQQARDASASAPAAVVLVPPRRRQPKQPTVPPREAQSAPQRSAPGAGKVELGLPSR